MIMQTDPVGIIGASGYSGLEASRILALHPHVELKLLGSDKWAGETAARRAGLPGAAGKRQDRPPNQKGAKGRGCPPGPPGPPPQGAPPNPPPLPPLSRPVV